MCILPLSLYIYIIIYTCAYIYIYIYIHIHIHYTHTITHDRYRETARSFPGSASPATPNLHRIIIREFRDVVFEDVVFDSDSSVTPY